MNTNVSIVAIVEDDPIQLDAIAQVISDFEIETQTFLEVPDTETVALLPQPDVVLLDIHLHESGGTESAELAHRVWPGVPKVVYTGDNRESTRIACLASGCDDVLVKGALETDIDLIVRTLRESFVRRQGQLACNSGNAVASARLALESARLVRPTIQRLLELSPIVLPKEA